MQVIDAGLSPNDLLPRRLQAPPSVTFCSRRSAARCTIACSVRWLTFSPANAGSTWSRTARCTTYLFRRSLRPMAKPCCGPAGLSWSMVQRQRAVSQIACPRPLGFAETRRVWETTSCLAFGYNGEGRQRCVLPKRRPAASPRCCGGKALVGPASKREALFRPGPDARYLHISCHGEFDPDVTAGSRCYILAPARP